MTTKARGYVPRLDEVQSTARNMNRMGYLVDKIVIEASSEMYEWDVEFYSVDEHANPCIHEFVLDYRGNLERV